MAPYAVGIWLGMMEMVLAEKSTSYCSNWQDGDYVWCILLNTILCQEYLKGGEKKGGLVYQRLWGMLFTKQWAVLESGPSWAVIISRHGRKKIWTNYILHFPLMKITTNETSSISRKLCDLRVHKGWTPVEGEAEGPWKSLVNPIQGVLKWLLSAWLHKV